MVANLNTAVIYTAILTLENVDTGKLLGHFYNIGL
jgi:hypothetical protein